MMGLKFTTVHGTEGSKGRSYGHAPIYHTQNSRCVCIDGIEHRLERARCIHAFIPTRDRIVHHVDDDDDDRGGDDDDRGGDDDEDDDGSEARVERERDGGRG